VFNRLFIELPPISYLTLADKMMIGIYTVFVGAGVTVLLHQRNIDKAEKTHSEYDIHHQIRLDKKMLGVTLAGLVAVSAVLLPL